MLPIVLDEVRRKRYSQKVLTIQSADLIGYWQMAEPSGGVAVDSSPQGNDGAYSGVTLGQPGIGDGKTSTLFDGSTSINNIYSAGLNTDFDGTELTAMIWVKMRAASVWLDGKGRDLFHVGVDITDDYFVFRKTSNNNELQLRREGNNVSQLITKTSVSSLEWFHLAITISETDDEFIGYFTGVREGSILNSLGAYSGVLGSDDANIGDSVLAGIEPHDGVLAHAALWSAALSENKIARLSKV